MLWILQVTEFGSTGNNSRISKYWNLPVKTHGHQIRRAKKTSASKLASISLQRACSYSRYEFLSALSHMADNLPTEQLADVNSSDDDETETYDVDEALAATTSTSSSFSSAPSDVAPPVMTAERAVCEVHACLLEPKAPLALVPCGHSRFCRRCADELQRMHLSCPFTMGH